MVVIIVVLILYELQKDTEQIQINLLTFGNLEIVRTLIKEKVVFEFTIAASSIPNQVDDNLSNQLRKYWDDGEIVEILGVISLFGFLNRWNDSMGTRIEEGADKSGKNLLKLNPLKHYS